jgi:hypothetical protein
MNKPIVIRRRVDVPRNSFCGSIKIRDLDFTEWFTGSWPDRSIYLLIPHESLQVRDKSIHRVYPRIVNGYSCSRLGMKQGRLYWLYDRRG